MSFGGFRCGQENRPLLWAGPGGGASARLQVTSKAKYRTVLGVLSENEQRSRRLPQGAAHAKRVPMLDKALPIHPTLSTCFPGSSFAVLADKPVKDVLPAASTMVVAEEPQLMEEDLAAFQHRDFRLFLDLSSGSLMDASMQSQPEEELLESQDVFAVTEYSEDIHRHLRERELLLRPKPGYLKKQPDITNCMRIILVDWLAEVCEEYKLCPETFFLAANYLDRFLSCMSVLRAKLQLVGTAAILLAAKYEEIYPPDVDEFVYITDDTYSKKQLLRMEHLLLKVLAFDLTVPTAHQFLWQYLSVEPVSSKMENLGLYLAELSLMEVDPFLQYSPSTVAAAAYALANYTLNKSLWPDSLQVFTGYTLSELAPSLKALHRLYQSAGTRAQKAIYEKYKAVKYCSVSLISPPHSIPIS